MKYQQKFSQLAVIVLLSFGLPACSWFSVYKIDIPQGTPISDDKLAQVQVGMSANQVLYLLGSPAVQDTLNPNRWDYLYDFTAGTVAKREKNQAFTTPVIMSKSTLTKRVMLQKLNAHHAKLS